MVKISLKGPGSALWFRSPHRISHDPIHPKNSIKICQQLSELSC